MDRKLLSLTTAVLASALSGCSSGPAPEKKAEVKKAAPPAEPVSAQSAAFAIYQVARQWSGDVEILRLENINLADVKAQPGKYGAWRATLASKKMRKKRDYTYSVIEADATLHKGVFAQQEEGWMPNPQVRPFPIQQLKIDSPIALENALKRPEVQDYLKKKPDTPVQMQLEWSGQTLTPSYRVIWGNTVSASDISIYIDCNTGTYLKKAR